MWFIGVEVEQETSAPPPKKILDPPLHTPLCGNKFLMLELTEISAGIYFLRFSFQAAKLRKEM